MASSDVCPTEDALKAFLEYLVDPMLPTKPSARDNPPLSQQQSVAKQGLRTFQIYEELAVFGVLNSTPSVHSVVLLYNYYHRKQYPELAFLSFDEFCKLAVVLRPTLSEHTKSIQKPDETGLVDLKQLSITEGKILDACNVCKCLDASKHVPDIEGWPISKVAVLLITDKKEDYFLLFSSITEGVWSLVEKDVETTSQSSEITSGVKHMYKRKRIIKKSTKNELNFDEDGILQIGYSAVKEAAGIDKTDITILESHTVYSHSKTKTASRFYIMKCSQLINQEFTQVPIKYLIESLRGPLVKKSSGSWTVTSVVEYFHVLPYSEIISEWISRETFSNSLRHSKLSEKNMMVGHSEMTQSRICSEGMSDGLDLMSSSDAVGALNQNEKNGSSASIKEAQDVYVDSSLASPSKNKECQHIANTLQDSQDNKKIENPSVQHCSNQSKKSTKAEYGDSTRMLITECGTKNQSSSDKICSKTSFENDSMEECALIANNPHSYVKKLQNLIASKGKTSQTARASFKNDSKEECALIANNPTSDLEKLQSIASKGKPLSQTALNALVQKRNALALQQRMIEDDIALCDKKIQSLLTSGEDELELKIESIIEGCNDTWVRNQGRMRQHLEDRSLPPCIKRRRLTEAVLIMQSPCKELDNICHQNGWLLPIYRVSESDGGFQSNVAVKGLDFECCSGGNLCWYPDEARESAAAKMLANLRSMAK